MRTDELPSQHIVVPHFLLLLHKQLKVMLLMDGVKGFMFNVRGPVELQVYSDFFLFF